MKQAYVKGTNTKIIGTLERIEGRAGILGFEGDDFQSIQHNGETEVFWDGQETQQRDGKDIYLDEDGEEYTEDELELRDGELEET